MSSWSYLSSLLPLSIAFAYAVTFYLTDYNEIYYSENNSYDDSDLPYTIAMIECCLAAVTALLGLVSFATKPTKNISLVYSLFFGVGTIMSLVFIIIRGSHLGIFGGDESTCTDASLAGCPTTRYEAINDDIQFTSPSGGDCQFFFWGPDMKPRYSGDSACNGYGETDGVCGPLIENYMDWTKSSSYGWRDDPADIQAASQGQIATIDKIHNMKYLFSLQSTIGNVSIPNAYAYSKQPSIASCWYWGCSEVCQPHRFRVNRWWFISSVALFVIHMICLVLALISWRSNRQKEFDDSIQKPSKAASDVEQPQEGTELNFSNVSIGRRKRRLIQNPSGLQF